MFRAVGRVRASAVCLAVAAARPRVAVMPSLPRAVVAAAAVVVAVPLRRQSMLSKITGNSGGKGSEQPTLTFNMAKAIGQQTLQALDNDHMTYAQALAEIKVRRRAAGGNSVFLTRRAAATRVPRA